MGIEMVRLRDFWIIIACIAVTLYLVGTHESDADRERASSRKLITDLFNQMEH